MWGIVDTHLSLEEYWQTLQISECAGYGIKSAPSAVTGLGCSDYWDQNERYFLAFAIAKAEERMKQSRWLGWPIRREYFTQEYAYSQKLHLDREWVRCVGVKTDTFVKNEALVLSAGAVINDPVTFTVNVSFTDPDELVLYYTSQTPALRYHIRPSYVEISGGVATVHIPRCRLLDRDLFVNYASDATRPDYTDDANFETHVDVYRNYCKPPGANLTWIRHVTGCACSVNSFTGVCSPTAPCGETLQYACGYVVDQKNGWVQFEPVLVADDGSFTATSMSVGRCPDKLQIQYMAGYFDRYEEIDPDIIRAIIAVAHNNLPEDYCTCAMQKRYYKRDANPIEPAVSLGLGPSTWGIFEAVQIVKERRVFQGGFL